MRLKTYKPLQVLTYNRDIDIGPSVILGLPSIPCYNGLKPEEISRIFSDQDDFRDYRKVYGVTLLAGGVMDGDYEFSGQAVLDCRTNISLSFVGDIVLSDSVGVLQMKGVFITETHKEKQIRCCRCFVTIDTWEKRNRQVRGFRVNIPFTLKGNLTTSPHYKLESRVVVCTAQRLCSTPCCFTNVRGVKTCSDCASGGSLSSIDRQSRLVRALLHTRSTPAAKPIVDHRDEVTVASKMSKLGYFVAEGCVKGFLGGRLPIGLRALGSIRIHPKTEMTRVHTECPVVIDQFSHKLDEDYKHYADSSRSPLLTCSIPLAYSDDISDLFPNKKSKNDPKGLFDSLPPPQISNQSDDIIWKMKETSGWSSAECSVSQDSIVNAFEHIRGFLSSTLGQEYDLVALDFLTNKPSENVPKPECDVKKQTKRVQWWHRDTHDGVDPSHKSVSAMIPLEESVTLDMRARGSYLYDTITVNPGDFAVWFGWVNHRGNCYDDERPRAFGYFLRRDHSCDDFQKQTNWDLNWVSDPAHSDDSLYMFIYTQRSNVTDFINNRSTYWDASQEYWTNRTQKKRSEKASEPLVGKQADSQTSKRPRTSLSDLH